MASYWRVCQLAHKVCVVSLVILSMGVANTVVADNNGGPADSPLSGFTSVFAVYADNRTRQIGNYVTPDLALLTYSLMRSRSIADVEQNKVIPTYATFLGALLAALPAHGKQMNVQAQQDIALNDTVSESAMPTDAIDDANVYYLDLLLALLDDRTLGTQHPLYAEQQRILDAKVMDQSDFWGYRIDYTQFKPRGRYADDATLGNFFRSFRYASAILFPVQASAATGISEQDSSRLVEQASRLIHVIGSNPSLHELRQELNAVLRAQMGRNEDLSDAQWLQAEAYYEQSTRTHTSAVENPASDSQQMAVPASTPERETHKLPAKTEKAHYILQYAQDHQLQPVIVSGLVNVHLLEPSLSVRDVQTGWRLMPQRYSADAAFNQQLLYPQTGEFSLPDRPSAAPTDILATSTRLSFGPFGASRINARWVKGFPVALESAAALGNQQAFEQIQSRAENRVAGYANAFARGQQILGAATGLEAVHNMVVSQGSLSVPAQVARDRLDSLLAFQTWQRYLQLLYRKQSYTPISKGASISPPRQQADLEPATGLYLALAAASRFQLRLSDNPSWDILAQHCERLARISQGRAHRAQLTSSDIQYLNQIDSVFLGLAGSRDAPIVVDVHTEPNSAQVLQQAIGYPRVFRQQGMRGARTSFHEFKQPIAQRLTNQEWMERLSADGQGQGGLP